MKKIFRNLFAALALLMAFQSCKSQEKVVVNREVETQRDGKMLLGQQSLDQFLKEPYYSWYNDEYANYQVDEEAIRDLRKEKLNSHQITVFLGTWCSDSHREFPRLMRILDELKYPQEKLIVYGLNRKYESPSGEEGKHNIQRVPTIIVRKYGRELGRIIEFPKTGFLEKDMLEIVRKRDSSVSDLFKK